MDKNFINIKAEELDEGTIQANFKGGVKNFNQLISLGGALIQTYLQSAVEIIRQNTDEKLDLPDEFIQLTIMDALIDKIANLLNLVLIYYILSMYEPRIGPKPFYCLHLIIIFLG